jgi:hypothetical protein
LALKARERHVFTLPAIALFGRRESKKRNLIRRLRWPAQVERFGTTPDKLPEISEIAKGANPDPLGESLPYGAKHLGNLVALPISQASGVYYATIIQHSARNLHENRQHRKSSERSI